MDTRETIADIVREMRREAPEICEWGSVCIGKYADRIEAATKREREERHNYELAECERCARANAAAMRAALEKCKKLFDGGIMREQCIRAARRKVNAALAAPPRNCDIGTLKEQGRRYIACCKRHNDCPQCPANTLKYKAVDCALAWAQMPYEADEAKGGEE